MASGKKGNKLIACCVNFFTALALSDLVDDNYDPNCPCGFCIKEREKAAATARGQGRDLIHYTVRCGYQGLEPINEFYARKKSFAIPGIPDLISCPCKGCGGRMEEIVSQRLMRGKRK
ncbi:MAG: hypothetical protein M3275_01520 [Thermoproteota archaeon]|nr:hypothetical protein [Thermoproteota archaeon]